MVIAYIIEEVDFSFGEEEGCCDGVDGGITPALQQSVEVRLVEIGKYLVEETACFIEVVEVG